MKVIELNIEDYDKTLFKPIFEELGAEYCATGIAGVIKLKKENFLCDLCIHILPMLDNQLLTSRTTDGLVPITSFTIILFRKGLVVGQINLKSPN